MVEKIKGVVGNANFDSRLAMQYAFSVLCAQEVSPFVLIGRAGYLTNCVGNLGLFGTHLVNVGVKCSMNSRDPFRLLRTNLCHFAYSTNK